MRLGRSVSELARDYAELVARCPPGLLPDDLAARLQGFHRFVHREGHHLARRPELLFPLAWAQPLDSPVRAEAVRREARGQGPRRAWFRLLHAAPASLSLQA